MRHDTPTQPPAPAGEALWTMDAIYTEMYQHVKNMGYVDWIPLIQALRVAGQVRDNMQAQIDELRAQLAEREQWEPVRYSTFVEDQLHNDTYLLITLDGSHLEIGDDVEGVTSDGRTVVLPSNIRLCRRKPKEQTE